LDLQGEEIAMKYLIIGGSIGGLSCARKIKELERNAEVIIPSEEKKPYSKMALPYLLLGESDIWLEVPPGVEFLGQEKVTEVLSDERKVLTAGGKEFGFDKLLIASGAGAAIPDFPGSTAPSVFTVRNLSDLHGIEGKLQKACQKKVIISGAGLVSMEMGDAVSKLGFKPVFLISSHRVFSMILDDEGSEILAKDLGEKGADIHFGERIRGAVSGDKALVVETASGKEFTGYLLVVGKAASPNTDFLPSSGIEVDRGVMVDEFLETNKKGIFAAGDVCQGYDLVYGEKRVNALWPVAIEQGTHAAMNMTHFKIPYRGSMARNIVTAFGNTVFIAGLSRASELESYKKREKNGYVRIVLRNGRLVGVICINVPVEPGAYLSAIQRQVNVSRLKDILLSWSLSYTHLFPSLRGT
jgi:nitrite reductase (NADH) large subunit